MGRKKNLKNFVDREPPWKLIQDVKHLLVVLGHVQPRPREVSDKIMHPIKKKLGSIPIKKWFQLAGSINTLKKNIFKMFIRRSKRRKQDNPRL